MANQIRFKRASGSDPGASDLVLGEPAVRTDTGELFFKKDDGSVAKVSGGGISDGDKGDITVSNSGGTFTIDNGVVSTAKIADDAITAAKIATNTITNAEIAANTIGTGVLAANAVITDRIADDAVTYAKIQNVSATNRILGRDSSGAGVIEEIAPSAVRTMLGLAASATTDTTNASNISSGTISDDRLPATISSDITGSAATLTNSRSIAGSSFNGSASIDIDYNNLTNLPTIPSNTNQLTNGAGFITATLTNEQVQDIVGAMVSGNTESGITVTYQDGDGTLDFSVASQTDNNFTTTLKNKLDGIESGATADQTAAEIKTLLQSNKITASEIANDTITAVQLANNSANVNVIVDGAVTTAKIADDAVTYAKIQNVSTGSRILGRISGAGAIQELSASEARTLINVENGATADQSASEILTLIKTVDGSGSGLDADLLDGLDSAFFVNASNLASGTIPDARFPSTLPAVDGSNLTGISAGATGGGSDEVFYENDQTVTTNYTITNGKNAMSAGPITINSGVTVTVGSGETLTIV